MVEGQLKNLMHILRKRNLNVFNAYKMMVLLTDLLTN